MRGMDVSCHQGAVDWRRARADGIEFAVLRAGYGRLVTQKDSTFERNYAACKTLGLPVGCYWYSYAATEEAVDAEVEACLQVIAGKSFPLGVWFDQEYEPAILALSNAARTRLAERFIARMERAGYAAGLYCSLDWLKNRLDAAALAKRNLWVARYGASCGTSLPVCLWQYTSSAAVDGVRGKVDGDVLYRFPTPPAQTQPNLSGAEAAGLGSANLKRGSRGEAVVCLQQLLRALGYDPGPADGIFGVRTRAAVRAFQRAAGLAADGIVGPATRAALAAAKGR